MKTIFYLLVFTIVTGIAINSKAAADTLFLNINGLAKAKIILKLNNGSPFKEAGILNPSSANWILKVSVNADADVKIKLTNTDGGDTKMLDNVSNNYIITNSKLNNDFLISNNLRIDILKNENDESIKFYQLNYMPGASADSTQPQLRDQPDNTEGLSVPTGYVIGSPVFDAYNLANGNNSFKTLILIHYSSHPESENLNSADYKDNKFLEPLAQHFININNAGDQAKLDLSGAASALGGINVTSFADGLAKFIVKRAKQELSIAFFQKFKNVINKNPDIATVFPQTASLLSEIDNEIYDYQRYIQNLREAFKKDISEIHRNLPGIIDNHPVFFTTHQPAKAALLSACYTASQLEDDAHPGDILADYPIEYLDSINSNNIGRNNFKGAIQIIQLISASLKNTSTAEDADYWAGIQQIRKVVNDKEVFKMYLGLLYQEAKIKYNGIQFDNDSLLSFLDKIADNYDQSFSIYTSYRSYILRFGEKVAALNNMIKEQQKDDLSDSAQVEKYANYFRTVIDLLDYASQALKLPVIKENTSFIGLDEKLKKYFNVSYAAADLTAAINRKNYSAAINSAVNIYNIVTIKATQNNVAINTTTVTNTTLRTADNISTASVISAEAKSHPDSLKSTLSSLIRYGSFMATVATAANSDDVEKAIETAALPTGSSRIKRVSDFNVSLNAFAGLFYGYERIKNVDSGKFSPNVYGLTAPVGVAASWGHKLFFIPTGRHEWSTSIYFSLIDVGAVAAFRFKDDSTSQVPNIKLKDIFSPGIFLSIGIPKTPLSFNIGTQMGPNLRKVSDKTNEFNNNIYWRYSASICVDIPVLNFYTKSK